MQIAAGVEAVAVVVLVGVTMWYARQTKRQADAAAEVLNEMRDQRLTAIRASLLQAYATILGSDSFQFQDLRRTEMIQRARQLIDELEVESRR